jgi:hypothetical protein
VFYEGRIVGRDGHVLEWLDDSTHVRLWHPMQEEPGEVLAWRDWLAELEIRQPFKQAHREVYLLTDAERTTRTYSTIASPPMSSSSTSSTPCARPGGGRTSSGLWSTMDTRRRPGSCQRGG